MLPAEGRAPVHSVAHTHAHAAPVLPAAEVKDDCFSRCEQCERDCRANCPLAHDVAYGMCCTPAGACCTASIASLGFGCLAMNGALVTPCCHMWTSPSWSQCVLMLALARTSETKVPAYTPLGDEYCYYYCSNS